MRESLAIPLPLPLESASWRFVREEGLHRSRLGAGGSTYEELAAYTLGPAGAP